MRSSTCLMNKAQEGPFNGSTLHGSAGRSSAEIHSAMRPSLKLSRIAPLELAQVGLQCISVEQDNLLRGRRLARLLLRLQAQPAQCIEEKAYCSFQGNGHAVAMGRTGYIMLALRMASRQVAKCRTRDECPDS